MQFFPHSYRDRDIIKVFYLSHDAQVIVLKNIKIYIKIAPICFVAVTPSSGSALSVLAKLGRFHPFTGHEGP